MSLRVGRDQLALMEREVALEELERDVIARLARRAPRAFTVVPESAFEGAVRLGVERAARRGLTRVGPVRMFVEMMITFGCAFDTDPLLPWAAAALEERHPTEMKRAERLHAAMTAYLKEVAGPGHANTLSALGRFEALSAASLASPIAGGDLEGAVEERSRALIPERFAYVGVQGARAAIRRHLEVAASHGARDGAEASVVSMMASLLGHGFAQDPLFPWAAAMAAEPAPGGGVAQAARAASAYCAKVLKLMGRE